jgi:hypothetical protein
MQSRAFPCLDQAIPLLSSPTDLLIETAKVLLAVNATPDRVQKVSLPLAALRTESGAAIVPLLLSLERRSLLAAQASSTLDAVSRHLSDASPAVREQAARTLDSVLTADYLDQPALHRGALRALAASLQKADPNVAARVAALRALGAAGAGALDNIDTRALVAPDRPGTFAEQGARLHAIGQLKLSAEQNAVLTVLRQTPLDALPLMQSEAEWAFTRLDPAHSAAEVALKLTNKYAAGYAVATEITALGDIPPADAVPALIAVSKQSLDHAERRAFVAACKNIAEKGAGESLIPSLAIRMRLSICLNPIFGSRQSQR